MTRKNLLLGAFLFWISGCGFQESKTLSPQQGEATFAWIRSNVIAPKCLNCHQLNNPLGLLPLETEQQVQFLVVPGEPERSRLFLSLNNGGMPKGGARLDQNEIDLIAEWIRNLAVIPSPSPSPSPVVTFQSLTVSLFNPSCVSCHHPPSPPQGLDLTNHVAISVHSSVVSGNAGASRLYQRVQNGSMPPTGHVSAENIQSLFDWIQDGLH